LTQFVSNVIYFFDEAEINEPLPLKHA